MITARFPRIALAMILATGLSLTACDKSEKGDEGDEGPETSEVAATPANSAAEADSLAVYLREATVTEADARATALKEVPGGAVQKYELEREGGKLIYSYDITVTGKEGVEEVQIDATTGAMVSHEHETPADEKKEAAEDAKAAAAGVKTP
ncbi:MAG: PepSY domain-containing protein [Gemmatimonadetes bacterium]|nr:PepSY domain-containing protein [Gemmatimonadota bacterium]MBL0177662.1 PepSY domain-containing protein [Gemmatimonadota bacterium]